MKLYLIMNPNAKKNKRYSRGGYHVYWSHTPKVWAREHHFHNHLNEHYMFKDPKQPRPARYHGDPYHDAIVVITDLDNNQIDYIPFQQYTW